MNTESRTELTDALEGVRVNNDLLIFMWLFFSSILHSAFYNLKSISILPIDSFSILIWTTGFFHQETRYIISCPRSPTTHICKNMQTPSLFSYTGVWSSACLVITPETFTDLTKLQAENFHSIHLFFPVGNVAVFVMGIIVRVFINSSGDRGSIPPKTKKWNLMFPCLTISIIRHVSRVSGATQGKEKCPPQHFGVEAIEKRVFGSPSTTVS